jgi:hypothetical protein
MRTVLNGLEARRIFNTQTDSYTLVLGDAGKVVEQNKATANNLTVPPNSSVAFPVGTEIRVIQYGAGATTLVAGSGVTLRSLAGNLLLAGQYAWADLVKRGTDEWDVAVFGTVPGPRELARAVTATAQTGITTVTDLDSLSISFTADKYAVEVELFVPWIYASTAALNGSVEIYDTTNSATKSLSLVACHGSGTHSAPGRAIERIAAGAGARVRKGRISRSSGTGTINVSVASTESYTGGFIRAMEVAT